METDFELNRKNKIIRNSQPTRISGVPPGVIFTAQYFTSGIFPNGSRTDVVIKFAAASLKANAIKILPVSYTHLTLPTNREV